MAQTSQSSEHALASTTVVDTDIHVGGLKEEAGKYLDEPYRSDLLEPRFAPWPTTDWTAHRGGKIPVRSISGPDEVHKLCREFHIDHPILNAFFPIQLVPKTEKAIAYMQAYNDALVSKYLDADEHFHGQVTIAPQAPEESAEEIDRLAKEDQIVSVFISNGGTRTPMGDSMYDPIYEAAQDHGLPVCYHASAGLGFGRDMPPLHWEVETYIENHGLSHPFAQMFTLTSLIAQGTPVKFPDLDFLFLEAGLTWVPYTMWRINREYGVQRHEAPLLEKSPEEYVRERFYFGTQPLEEANSPAMLKQAIGLLEMDRILFATDYPHFDFDNPATVSDHLSTFFNETDRRKVLSENAFELFDLK